MFPHPDPLPEGEGNQGKFMYIHTPTLTDFILHEEHEHPRATGSFTYLLLQLASAAKIVNSHVRRSGLADIMGAIGRKNAFGDEVQKLDIFSNDVFVSTLTESGQVHTIVSEELDKPHEISGNHRGEYIVYIDPLDGSSNIDVNSPIGTTFGIYHKDKGLLQKGKEQVAAGYILYGSSTLFVYTSGHGVNGFTLDPAIGSFLLSHEDMQIPKKGTIYSMNEAYFELFFEPEKDYVSFIKKEKGYTSRYCGAMASDIHRILLKGGIFLYPANKKSPEGKLRLMIEINPMSFIMEEAGGMSIGENGKNPLDIMPLTKNDRSPFITGSRENIQEFLRILDLRPE